MRRPSTATKDDPTVHGDRIRAPLLDVGGLYVRYGTDNSELPAVADVSFQLGAGERVALVGESGSGKTTLGLTLAGMVTESIAQVRFSHLTFQGQERATTLPGRLPRRVPGLAMVFQDPMSSLDPVWTIGSQLRAVLRGTAVVPRRERDALARQWLRRAGLTDVDRVMVSRPYELSGGMRQRVMLALALAGQPRLLIADEPTSALDASLARGAMELMLTLASTEQVAVLVISHDIHLSREFSDRILVMYGGRIVEQVRSTDLDTSAHPYTAGLVASVPTLDAADLEELPTIAPAGPNGQHDPDGGCDFRARCTRRVGKCAQLPRLEPHGAEGAVRCWMPISRTIRESR